MSPVQSSWMRLTSSFFAYLFTAYLLAAYLFITPSFAQPRPPLQPEPWTVVRANALFDHGEGLSEFLAVQLQKELGEPVKILQGEGDQTAAATQWSLEHVPHRRAVLMLSEGSSTVMGSASRSSYHLGNFEPVSVLMEMPWCLFALKNSPVVTQRNVLRWLNELQRPVTIAVGVPRGKPMLWVHALTRNASQNSKIALQVQAQLYTDSRQMQYVLQHGADFAIGRCMHMLNLPSEVAAIGVAQKNTTPYLSALPIFTDLGLPPLSRGWYGAFVPVHMQAQHKQRVIAALERIVQLPEVNKLILQRGLTPLQLSRKDSKTYIEEYTRTWQSVADLLEWTGVDASTPLQSLYAVEPVFGAVNAPKR